MKFSTASIRFLHSKPLWVRTASIILQTFWDMVDADMPMHSASALNENCAS